MKPARYIPILLIGLNLTAQTALYNRGNMRIYGEGKIGLHTDLINDSTIEGNLGLVGFHDKEDGTPNLVSGTAVPVFYDVEIHNPQGVLLRTGISNSHLTVFGIGNFITDRTQQNVYYNFLKDAQYIEETEVWNTGETNLSKIDGYAAITDQQHFIFPVGDATQLRPLALRSSRPNGLAKCAYYRGSPSLDPNSKPSTIETIGDTEFWHLTGDISSSIQIGWNEQSRIRALTDDINTLIPVGWSISGRSWVNLGVRSRGGDIDEGYITSNNFKPNDYAAITFATTGIPTERFKLDNYLVTPNGDGVNDFLLIEGLEISQDHMLRIFDRNGIKVYEEKNYTNGFTGLANTNNMVIRRDTGLPNGVYYYIVDMLDLKLSFQGFLYLEK